MTGATYDESTTRRVTVVVATQNRLPDLRQSLPRHEGPVVLVDNGSTDGTAAYVREHFPAVRVVELAENRGATARNLGVELAETPYVAFADDDSWWAPGALDLAAERLDVHPRLAVLAARTLIGTDERLDAICDQMAAAPLGTPADLPGPSVVGFLACAAVVRRSAYLQAGGFDEVVFFGGEEERLTLDLMTAGWGLAYVPKVVSHHHPSPSRDPGRRRARGHRNRILTAVMRRPWPVVASAVSRAAADGAAGRAGIRAAARRGAPALARRRVVPPRVEVARRLAERAP